MRKFVLYTCDFLIDGPYRWSFTLLTLDFSEPKPQWIGEGKWGF